MTTKVTILATSLIIACAQGVEATPLAVYPDSMQRRAANDWALCLDPAGVERRSEANYALNALRWSAIVPMNLDQLFLPWGSEDHVLSFHFDYASALTSVEISAADTLTLPSLAYQAVAAALTTPGEIESELTPLSGDEAARALRRAWKRATTQTPSLEVLAILTAHWAHETAAGAAMFNHNFGGIKGRGPDGFNFIKGSREGFGARTRVVRGRFRAYINAASGADDYLSLLLRRYTLAIEAAERGDVTEFVGALHDGKYFTGSVEDYTRAICKRRIAAREWAVAALGRIRPTDLPNPTAPAELTEYVQFGAALPQQDRCADALR